MNAAAAWPQVKIGDLIIDLQPGFACGAHNSSGTGVPHLRPMNVSTEGRIDRSVLKFVGLEFANRPEQRLRRGDVLFNNTNSPELVGKTALFTEDDEPAFSNHMTRLRPDPTRIDPEFLALMLHQAWRSGWFALHCNNHVSQASIGRGVLEALEISLPPLEIQRSIGALNARVSGSRRVAVQHLYSARVAIDRFRQSVLAQAYDDAARDRAGIGLVELDSILAEPLKNGYSAKPVPYKTSTKVLTLTATTSGCFDGRHFKFTDQTFGPEAPYWVRDGDIYVQRGNTAEFVGVPALYEGPDNQFLFPDLMIRVRAQPHIAPRFLWYMLLAPQTRRFLRERATGSAGNMPKINHSILETAPVPLASDRVRADLVAHLDAALAGADGVKSRLHDTERTLSAVVASILAKCLGYGARGQLTPSVRESSGS